MLERLRKQIQRNRYSSNPLIKGSTLLLRSPWYLWQFATDGFYRTTIFNRLRNGRSLHLTCNYTKMDRYPEIFSLCRDYFGAPDRPSESDLRLLSFGCSTGEEAFSLRNYFPQAHIFGADISDWNLKQARKKTDDERIRFMLSNHDNLAAAGPFDAIFCMAVLLRMAHHMEPAESSAEVYPIDKFEEQVAELDGLLKPGGLLVIYHANYRLGDTRISDRFQVLPGKFQERDLTPKYDRNNRLLADSDTQERIFIKQRDAT